MSDEARRHGITFLAAAFGAAIVYVVFHSVHESLTQAAIAVGYVDPTGSMAIFFSYLLMVGGTGLLGVLAAWAGFNFLRALRAH